MLFFRSLILLVFLSPLLFASSISGFVFDKTNGESLIGANLYIEGIGVGASTNLNGYYVIPQVAAGTYTLVCDYQGYQPHREEIRVENSQPLKINIIMVESILETETIVVTADSIPTIEKLYNKPISGVNLSGMQIRRIPQVAEADLLRSLQTLPGVEPLSDFSSALYIRGGTPDQNLYLLDGTDVYNPEHAFGLFSTFNTDAIKQVDLSKGGFGAEYGGRLSSILNITNIDGNREQFEGTASISLLSARTTLQMPISDFGSVSGSVRRTYFDQTVAKMIDDLPDYYFYDGNLKAFFDINANNNLTLSAYGGRDVLDFIFNTSGSDETGFKYDWGNATASARWTTVISPILFANFWITASRFSSYFNLDEFDISEQNVLSDYTIKGSVEHHPSNRFGVVFGFEHKFLDVRFAQQFPNGEVNVRKKPTHAAFYLQTEYKPFQSLEVETGLRWDYFKSDQKFSNIAPRLLARYRLSEQSNLKLAMGRYHQYLHRIPRFVAADIWTVSDRNQTFSSSDHLILGYQRALPGDIELEVEGFYKTYSNIYSFNQNFLAELDADYYTTSGKPVYTSTSTLFNRGDGNSVGLEFLLRKDRGIYTGWLAYTYSATRYIVNNINNEREFYPRHDRTSTVNLTGDVDLDNLWRAVKGESFARDDKQWTFGFNFVYSTGQPYTEPGSAYQITATPSGGRMDVYYHPTQINNIRLPYYARLDVSLTYKILYDNWTLSPYLQVYNVGNRKNLWFATYDFKEGVPEPEPQHMLPLLPTIGVTANF
jgi:hypothetical protein